MLNPNAIAEPYKALRTIIILSHTPRKVYAPMTNDITAWILGVFTQFSTGTYFTNITCSTWFSNIHSWLQHSLRELSQERRLKISRHLATRKENSKIRSSITNNTDITTNWICYLPKRVNDLCVLYDFSGSAANQWRLCPWYFSSTSHCVTKAVI